MSFTPVFQMKLTGNVYVVPFVLHLQDLYAPIVKAQELTSKILATVHHIEPVKILTDVRQIDQAKKNVIVELVTTHLNDINKKFQELHYSLNDFLMHILGYNWNQSAPVRHPRGAINFIGSLSNTLFGTATQSQVDKIHEHLHTLDDVSENERKLLNVHSHVLNITLLDLTSVHDAIDKLQKASDLTEKIFSRIIGDINQNENKIILLESLLHVQLVLSSLSTEHMNLKIGIQEMIESTVSPYIVTNTLLLGLLRDISEKTSSLLFPPSPEFLGLHTTAIRVIFKRTALQGLNFYLLIPLKGNLVDTFDVFEMASLPYPIPKSELFMLYNPNKKYLVISSSRLYYYMVNDFDVCRKNNQLLICPPIQQIYTSSTECCELAIFLQRKTSSSLCQKFLLKQFPPIFIKGEQGWTYSTSAPLDITLNCKNMSVHKIRHTLVGTGNLEVGQGCRLYSDAFTLPDYSTIMQKEVIKITPYPFSISLTFESWEYDFLVNASNISLPGSIDMKPIPLQNYMEQLQPLMQPPSPTNNRFPEWLLILLQLGVTLLIVAVLAGLRRLRARWSTSKNHSPSHPHELVELQCPDAVTTPEPTQPDQQQPHACPHRRKAEGPAVEGGAMLCPRLK